MILRDIKIEGFLKTIYIITVDQAIIKTIRGMDGFIFKDINFKYVIKTNENFVKAEKRL